VTSVLRVGVAKGVLPVETNVIYKYRAPRGSWTELTTISYETMDLTSEELSNPTVPYGAGETISLRPWRSVQDHEEELQEYRVVDRFPLIHQTAEHGPSLLALVFVVTDPDA
jgi:hypothetical protein